MKREVKIPDLHPEFIEKDGERRSVVLPYKEYEALQELLEDFGDLMDLRAAKAADEGGPSLTLAEAKAKYGPNAPASPRAGGMKSNNLRSGPFWCPH